MSIGFSTGVFRTLSLTLTLSTLSPPTFCDFQDLGTQIQSDQPIQPAPTSGIGSEHKRFLSTFPIDNLLSRKSALVLIEG